MASISAFYYVQSQESTTSQTTASTSSDAVSVTTSSLPALCSTFGSTNSSQGLALSVYLPASPKQGAQFCIYALLQNGNQSTISSLSGNVTVVGSSGAAIWEDNLVPFEAGSQVIPPGGTLDFTFLWNTSQPYRGAVPQPGTYSVDIIVQYVVGGTKTPISIETNAPLSLEG